MSPRSVHLTPAHEEFRAGVRATLAAHVLPHLPDWERARAIPRDAWERLGSWGYLGLLHTTDDLFRSVVLLEELGRTGYSGFRAAVAVHSHMATHYLAAHGSAALKDRYLTPAIAGTAVAALAVTEPQAGSDLGALAVTATPDGDDLLLDGTKSMITNGTTADFLVVAARTGRARTGPTGVSLVVVETATPGVEATPQEKPGWHSAATAELRFTAARVPASNVIGKRDSGFYYLMRGFQLERLVAATLALGGIEHCLDATRDHLRTRHAFGAPLASRQAPRHTIADLTTRLHAARHLTYDAVRRLAGGDLPATEASMAKLLTTELACEVADRCLQLHGSPGYAADSPVARAHAEARAATMAAGPSEVMRDLIAAALLDHP
ncbi:acyl-CoA dehydrogenase family protein [Actinokineospora spheciospongiae]|uniref:acyl-CoA dehydrogenase family protein n=1 Tax=Actinokineospora spheciospongiae TaxID=909613 RepID=UPI000D718501|nr:acyl-CoA dehydrogenase family protein [Actinokineospora spheciospongiae]PWW59444.1 alkylation response protein AidB-like acyl-CoA dehydrogenase [Actinokineospora spheciospongiae]